MLIDFSTLEEITIPRMNGGEGAVSARMYLEPGKLKFMTSRLPAGASIGLHAHTTSFELDYVLSGTGEAICGGAAEALSPGKLHYCPQGQSHAIRATGPEDLVLLTVVPEIPV